MDKHIFYKANVLIENALPDYPTWELVIISPESGKRFEGEEYVPYMLRLEKLVHEAVDASYAKEELLPGLKYIGVVSIEPIHDIVMVS